MSQPGRQGGRESLSGREIEQTAAWIASVQLPDGMIPWYPGGHADPWNHLEAAMALALGGFITEAEAAYDWLASTQLSDGSWCCYHLAGGVEDPRRDPNVCAYVATGVWWHYLLTADLGFLEEMWAVVEPAVEFVLRLQRDGGEVIWSLDADGRPGRFALLSANCSIHHSLRAGVACAGALGLERPEWELAAARVAHAVAYRPEAFLAKDRWAMDWYYPVLSGILAGPSGALRLNRGWQDFVMEGLGVRCVSDRPWVTAAETAECAMAVGAAGMVGKGRRMLGWTRHLRGEDGSYWTGCVHPECVRFPGGERSTYTAAAVLMADHVLHSDAPSASVFSSAESPRLVYLVDDLPGDPPLPALEP